jgi:hypothetical protein
MSRKGHQHHHPAHDHPHKPAHTAGPRPAPRPLRFLGPRLLAPFDLVLFALSLAGYLLVAVCVANAVPSLGELRDYVGSRPPTRPATVVQASVFGPPPAGLFGPGGGTRVCRVELDVGTVRSLAAVDIGLCRQLTAGEQVPVRVWRGRVTEVVVAGVSWRTFWHPLNGVAGWSLAALIALAPSLVLTLVLRLDLHRRWLAWHRLTWPRLLARLRLRRATA